MTSPAVDPRSLTPEVALEAAIAASEVDPLLPAVNPQMAEVFREKTATLAADLEHSDNRDGAPEALRAFLDRIVIPTR